MDAETEPALRTGPARSLFAVPFVLSNGHLREFDVSPDGKTFVFVRGPSEAPWRQFELVQNWTASK
ncbi:MAG TPA: hypothetical protein VKH43_02385 [Thermoanaerobaculia bacterium]|nr:hypothetical protein [Thermoanaerobaculia bacterium]